MNAQQQALIAEIDALVGDEPITLYQLAKLWNVRPQMAYNYKRNGLIKTCEDGRVDAQVAVAFLAKQAFKRI